MKNTPISIKEMMSLSNKLFALHKKKWMKRTPESNIYWISWLVAEVGEVIDIIKKKGSKKIMHDMPTRQEMLEEIVDCYMYLADILIRYGYSAEDFSKAYREKMNYNVLRNYDNSKTKKDKQMNK